jgi:hypothetical protein
VDAVVKRKNPTTAPLTSLNSRQIINSTGKQLLFLEITCIQKRNKIPQNFGPCKVGKVKFSPCLIKHHAMKTYWGVET